MRDRRIKAPEAGSASTGRDTEVAALLQPRPTTPPVTEPCLPDAPVSDPAYQPGVPKETAVNRGRSQLTPTQSKTFSSRSST